jgi:hypothetical protein
VPPSADRWSLRLWLLGALWLTPLWLVTFPPMVDYPQQLAAAAIIRWYGDPARALQQTFELALWHPHGLFELITAGLAWLLPVEAAGKLTVSLCLAAVPPCVLALCRRTGRPAWYAVLALAVTYSYSFYWGLTDNLLACPLLLLGVALADRAFDRPFGVRSWGLLAACGLLFYGVHLQTLLVFAGAAGWLALVRRPGPRRLAVWLSPLLPGLALGMGVLGWVHLHAARLMTGYQQRLETEATRFTPPLESLARLPSTLFGAFSDGSQLLLAAVLLALVGVLAVPRPAPPATPPAGAGGESPLYRTRFATLAAWLGLLYFALPEFSSGYLMAERMAPLAFLLAIPALPCPPAARRRVAGLLTAGLLALHLLVTTTGFLSFAAETAGLSDLLDRTAPGQALAGLIYEPYSQVWTVPVLVHVPAYYQVRKGGRVHFSFAQFFNAPVRYRPGQNWEDALLAEWNEWNPHHFVAPRHGGRFRYFLVRGGPERLVAAFGPALRGMRVISADRWFLVERPAPMVEGR